VDIRTLVVDDDQDSCNLIERILKNETQQPATRFTCDFHDKPAPGAMIVLAPLDLKSNPALFRRDQADSDGTFALNFVVPGRYTLMAIEDGWDLEWADPDVLQEYIATGESVQIVANGKIEVKVKVK